MEMVMVEDWSSSSLPNDVVYEILTRTPLRSIYECRLVCRDWRRITYEPSFILLHSRRTQTVSGYFVQRITRNVYSSTFVPFCCNTSSSSSSTPRTAVSLDFLPRGTKILSVANRYGVLLCEAPTNSHRIPRYVLCKPTTMQWRPMPNPKTRLHTERVAMFVQPTSSSSSRWCFKIVRLSTDHRNLDNLVLEVFDSKTWRWRRRVGCLPYLLFSPHPGVEVQGVAYWLVPDRSAVFAFDFGTEDWRLISLPRSRLLQEEEEEEEAAAAAAWSLSMRLVVGCEGRRLCLLRIRRNNNNYYKDVAAAADIELEIWAMAIDPYSKACAWENIGRRGLACLTSTDAVEDLYTQEVAFLTSIWGATWCDMRNGEMSRVDINAVGFATDRVFKYESDLQSCDQLGYTPDVLEIKEEEIQQSRQCRVRQERQ